MSDPAWRGSVRSPMNWNKDRYGGALMVLIGLASIVGGARFRIGTLVHMGPGFFPVAVGAIMALIGIAIALKRGRRGARSHAFVKPDWRGWGCIIGSMLAFMLLGAYGGLVSATFAIVFISALGDRRNTLKQAAWLALAMVAVGVVVFWWGLQLQLPLFGWH